MIFKIFFLFYQITKLIYISILLCFEVDQSWNFLFIAIPNLLAIIEILMRLNMPYYEQGEIIYKKRWILKNYLQQYLIWDLISFLPVFLVPLTHSILIFYYFRIKKIKIIFTRLSDYFELRVKYKFALELFKLSFFFLSYTHLMACLWYYIGSSQ